MMAYERLPKCRICGWNCDPESGTMAWMGIHEINPDTFRRAWMHMECMLRAAERLKGQPSKIKQFENRYEQWQDKNEYA